MKTKVLLTSLTLLFVESQALAYRWSVVVHNLKDDDVKVIALGDGQSELLPVPNYKCMAGREVEGDKRGTMKRHVLCIKNKTITGTQVECPTIKDSLWVAADEEGFPFVEVILTCR